ncbi:MAG: hypothetical protein H7Z38_17970 [Rubrivivax sp.]|nr:hypothetical protein [Pyrinomonadaceae bacterium]
MSSSPQNSRRPSALSGLAWAFAKLASIVGILVFTVGSMMMSWSWRSPELRKYWYYNWAAAGALFGLSFLLRVVANEERSKRARRIAGIILVATLGPIVIGLIGSIVYFVWV